MTIKTGLALTAAAFTCALTAALAQPLTRPTHNVSEMEPLLARIATYEFGQSREAPAQLTGLVDDSQSSPALLKQIEARLLQFVQSNATAAGKEVAFRELSLIATKASVPVLSGMLTRAETAEMARYTLASIPGPAADEALRTALNTASGKVKIGIINSLGQRRVHEAVPALGALASSSDAAMAGPALFALGEIADRPALDALAAARGKVSGPLQERALEAYLQCAGRLAAHGGKNDALKAYQRLLAPQEPGMVRIAALSGVATVEGKNAIPALAAEIASASPAVQGAAIIQAMSATTGKVKSELVLAAGERANPSAADALIQAVRDPDPDVRRNAIRALRNVAGPEQIPALMEVLKASAAAGRRDATQTLAAVLKRSQTAQIRAVIAAYQAAPNLELRLSLLEAVGQTSNAEALPVLRECLKDSSSEIVRGSILSLTDWAGTAPLPDLLSVAKTNTDAALQVLALRGYLKLVSLPAQRPNPESARLLADAMRLARQTAEKRSVLSLLPAYPCPEALQVAQEAQRDEAVAKEARAAADRIADSLKRR